MRVLKQCLFLLPVLFLAACGTTSHIGAGTGSSNRIEFMIEEGIELQAPVVTVKPFPRRRGVVHVGPDVSPAGSLYRRDAALTPLPQEDGLLSYDGLYRDPVLGLISGLYHGAKRDGTRQLVDYLIDDAGPGGHVRRFGEKPPTVRIAEGATPEMTSAAIRAVQTINASLPDTWKLRFASEAATRTGGQPPDGEIVIDFRPSADWPVEVPPGWERGGFGQRWFDPAHPAAEIVSGRVWIDTGSSGQDRFRPDIIAHEILYALGRNRADGTRFENTLMNGPSHAVPEHLLHPLDREALIAVYGWLPPKASTERIAHVLGPWSEVSHHLVGEVHIPSGPCIDADCLPSIPVVVFGVAARNRLAQPWVLGYPRDTDLQDAPYWSGRTEVRAFGRLVGITPANRSVTGRVDMTVDVESLDGTLRFHGLESWAAQPGALGTGDRWGDGNLEYTIAVHGDTFVQTGGDEGVVTGVFLGPAFPAPYSSEMGGTLNRSDLTAAFGGVVW